MTSSQSPLRRSQTWTVVLMLVGYTGYYLCRSNLAVVQPLMIEEMGRSGISADVAKVRLGTIVTLGTLAYALGKLIGGSLVDFLGGRRNFLAGMLGAVVFTGLFAMGGSFPIFTLAWVGNRLLQSIGWLGMLKITSRWFSFSSYGRVVGVLSLSYLFGDALCRLLMGYLIQWGLGWREVFYFAAGTLFVIFLVELLFLRETPTQLGLSEGTANPENVFGKDGGDPKPPGFRALVDPLLRNPMFWVVCVLSLAITLMRESFNNWSTLYLTEGVGLGKADAARTSALFPFFGGVSVLLAGYLGDVLGRGGRFLTILIGLLLCGVVLGLLAVLNFQGGTLGPIALVSSVAFLLIGPYSYLAGAVALDFGGKRGGATASGLIDFAGYLGGAFAGQTMAEISVAFGWKGVFATLAITAVIAGVLAGWMFVAQRTVWPTDI